VVGVGVSLQLFKVKGFEENIKKFNLQNELYKLTGCIGSCA
jgi:hypothetical protein